MPHQTHPLFCGVQTHDDIKTRVHFCIRAFFKNDLDEHWLRVSVNSKNSRRCVFLILKKEVPELKKNPKALLLTSRNFDYDDCEFEVSGISYYYIIPAGKLKEQQIEFKNEVADDELLLIIFFKDGSYKVFSLVRYNMSFLY